MAITPAEIIVGGGGIALAVYGFSAAKKNRDWGFAGIGIVSALVLTKMLGGLGTSIGGLSTPIMAKASTNSIGRAATYTTPEGGYYHIYGESVVSPKRYTVSTA